MGMSLVVLIEKVETFVPAEEPIYGVPSVNTRVLRKRIRILKRLDDRYVVRRVDKECKDVRASRGADLRGAVGQHSSP